MGKNSEGTVGNTKMLEDGADQSKNVQKGFMFEEITEKEDVDAISLLPDGLLVEILSRLPSLQEGIRTGTLSKRWTHLWTLVPSLIFQLPDLFNYIENPNSMSDFALLVDKTLSQCGQSKLKKFKVHALYDTQFESQFNNWIAHALSRNVEDLNLDFQCLGREGDFRLDQSNFFTNSCFTDLRLKGCALNPTGAISWTNLRSLCISYVHLYEDLIINLLSGSPLLESLVLVYYYGYGKPVIAWDDVSEINALSCLSLTECPQLKLKKFEVLSHHEVRLQSHVNSWICYAIRCNVEKIRLNIWSRRGFKPFPLDQIVFTGSCFTELTLDGCQINPAKEIGWKNLRSLCITQWRVNDDVIEKILSGSPVLETLELDKCYGYSRLDITSTSVKNLVLSGYMHGYDRSRDGGVIEINAPNILSLTIQHEMILRKFLLVNVSSLVEAQLNFTWINGWSCGNIMLEEAEQEMLKEVILNLLHVNEVIIGGSCRKALSCLEAEGFIVPSNVKLSDHLT